jgi:hypothetical protein
MSKCKVYSACFLPIVLVISMLGPLFCYGQSYCVVEGRPWWRTLVFAESTCQAYGQSGWKDLECPVDCDSDGQTDITFILNNTWGGLGGFSEIYVMPGEGYLVHLDNTYIHHYQYIRPGGGVVDTFRKVTVVRPFLAGDTVFSDGLMKSGKQVLYCYSYSYFGNFVLSNIDPFGDKTAWVIMTHVRNGDSTVYGLEIDMASSSGMKLLRAARFYPDYEAHHFLHAYPNPVTDKLYIGGMYVQAEIFSNTGSKLLYFRDESGLTGINLHHLKPGCYFVRLTGSSGSVVQKFIKN